MFAAVDLGSNSFRLHIGKYENGSIEVIESVREPNRLAAGLDKDLFLSKIAMQAGIEALQRLKTTLDAYPIKSIRAVATHTLRIAINAQDFLAEAEKALGCPIDIISGEEEGRLVYKGVANILSTPDEPRLVVDIGGGSTEIIFGRGKEIERIESFSVGTVRQSLSFFPEGRIDADAFEAAVLSAKSSFKDAILIFKTYNWKVIYGSSGTIRAIGEMISLNKMGDGKLTLENLKRLREEMIQSGNMDRLKLVGLRPQRTFSIVSGVSILIGLMQNLNAQIITPVRAGLRMGVMWDLYLKSTENESKERSINEFLYQYKVDIQRAKNLADIALHLFKKMNPESDRYSHYLYWVGLLHEVGMYISPTDYHKHGAYLVENINLAGFTSREQKKMSKLVLGQKGNLVKLKDFFSDTDTDAIKALLALRLSIVLFRAGINKDMKLLHLKVKKRIEITIPDDWKKLYPTLVDVLEREHDYWNEIGIDLNINTKRSS